MRNSYNHLIISVKIFRIELFCIWNYLCASLVAVFFLYFKQFLLNNFHLQIDTGQNTFKIIYQGHNFSIFGPELLLFESSKLA